MNTDIENPLPCPFCGCQGDKLLENLWSLEDEEVNAYECPECFAGAPVSSWNWRFTITTRD